MAVINRIVTALMVVQAQLLYIRARGMQPNLLILHPESLQELTNDPEFQTVFFAADRDRQFRGMRIIASTDVENFLLANGE